MLLFFISPHEVLKYFMAGGDGPKCEMHGSDETMCTATTGCVWIAATEFCGSSSDASGGNETKSISTL